MPEDNGDHMTAADNAADLSTNREPFAQLSSKIAQVCASLRPFEAMEYDPHSGLIALITEWLIPSKEIGRIGEILSQRRGDEKITVKRFDNNYKVAMVRYVKVQ
jgi:hypothetical protein